jgi:streptogramin lyase
VITLPINLTFGRRARQGMWRLAMEGHMQRRCQCFLLVAIALLGTAVGVTSQAPAQNFTEFQIPTAGSGPLSIATGSDGALWSTEQQANQIGRITTAGMITEFPIPTANSFPSSITAGPDGALWFVESRGINIGRISTAGVISEFQIPNASGNPEGITTGPDGALWFTESNQVEPGAIGRITTSGVITVFTLPTGNTGPWGITVGPDGALWYTLPCSIGASCTSRASHPN